MKSNHWIDEIWKYTYQHGKKDMALRACVILKRQGTEPDEKIFFELIKLLHEQRNNLLIAMEECKLHHSPPLFSPDQVQ